MSDPVLTAADRRTSTVVLGGLASGVSAYVFTILGARVLGEVAYAPVGVLWTIQYLMITVALLSPEAYVTREGRVPRVIVGWLVVTALTLGAVATWQGPMLFGGRSTAFTAGTMLVAVGYSAFSLARGLSAHRGHLQDYAIMSGGESLVRLAVAVPVLLVVATPEALGLTLASGAMAMTGWWWLRGRHDRAGGPAPSPPLVLVGTRRYLAATTTANAIAQLLLAGGPVLTALLGASPATTSRVFVTTTAARAPLVLVYSGLLARLLGASRDMPAALLRRRVWQSAVGMWLVAGLAVVAGAALGPPLVALAFGAGLRPSAAFAGLTGAAVVLTMGLLGANQVLIARGRASRLVVPWLVGLAVAAVAATMVDASADLRAGTASLAGLLATSVLLVPVVLRAAGVDRAVRGR